MGSCLQNTTDQRAVTQSTAGKLDTCCGSVSPVEHCMVLQDCLVAGKLLPDEIKLCWCEDMMEDTKSFLQERFYPLVLYYYSLQQKTEVHKRKKLYQKYA